MAIYHLTVKPLSKSRGQSAAAKFAYITRAGKYARQPDPCLATGHMNMPAFAKDASKYWKATDKHERKNATLAREIEVALPRELSLKQQQELVQNFIARVAPDLPVSYAIHKGRGRNPHAHILISERVNDGVERSIDKWFRRANPSDPAKGGAKKARLGKDRSWLQNTRKTWASVANEALRKAGHNIEIDHRSNQARGIREPPGLHVGMTRHSKDKSSPRFLKYKKQKQMKRRHTMNNGMKPAGTTPNKKKGREKDHGIEIPDLRPTAQAVGVIVWAWADSGKAALIDRGDNIELATGSLAEWRRAASLAKAKGWEGAEITANNKRSAYDAIRAHLEKGIPATKIKIDGSEINKDRLNNWIKKVAEDHNLTIPNTEDATEQIIEEAAKALEEEYVRPTEEQIRQALHGSMLDYSKLTNMLKETNKFNVVGSENYDKAMGAKADIAEALGSFMFKNPAAGSIALTQALEVLHNEKDRNFFLDILGMEFAAQVRDAGQLDELAQRIAANEDVNDIYKEVKEEYKQYDDKTASYIAENILMEANWIARDMNRKQNIDMDMGM